MIQYLQKKDKELIDQLFFNSWRKHTHMGWATLDSLLDKNEICLLSTQNRTDSEMLLGLERINPHAFWIQSLYVNEVCDKKTAFLSLVDEIRKENDICLYAISANQWLNQLLHQSGFQIIDHFVQLRCSQSSEKIPKTSIPDITLRTMTIQDIDKIIIVCESSFAPVWQLNEESLNLALSMSDYTLIAEKDKEIIAYLLASREADSVHLMRIAVDSRHQASGIGRFLVQQMFTHYSEKGITEFSVNTTEQNKAAIKLYGSFSFSSIIIKYPVLRAYFKKA